MADFFGIRNENEFYFAHYLSSLMDDELKDICSSEVLKITQDHLKRLVPPYLQLKAKRDRLSTRRGTFKDDVESYLEARKSFVEGLSDALGFTSFFNRNAVFAGKEITIPVSGMVKNPNGEIAVLLIESYRDFKTVGAIPEPTVLGNYLERSQLADKDIPEGSSRYLENRMLTGPKNQYPTWENLLGNEIFNAPSAPRFVIVFAENAILLADRSKWAERRSMIFELDEICERQEAATFRAMAALLAKESLAPDGTVSLPDRLDENSHKNAFGVSKSLRFAMREAIEMLGNAILENNPRARTETAEGTTNAFAAEKLSKECIIVMYRFLFVLFLESRKDLGYFERAEGTDDVFWSAYGLDHLRDLETVPLLTEADRNGHYFDESIKQLFAKIWYGVGYHTDGAKQAGCKEAFRIKPLKAHLFDPKRTELFNSAKIPNDVWQKIIYSLSIGESGTGKRKRKGRISYAQLGIQQLGSVYEALLSYTGFYAKEDLYEVCNAGVKNGSGATEDGEQDADETSEGEEAGAKADVFETGYFVTAKDLESYKPAERVTDPENPGKLLCHKKGTFIYRMAGRDRERSASYYTPTELTRCLVKQAIAERVTPEMKAKEIMELTVCEPAMGSAAFLNEMVDQLADIYLKRAQAESGKVIPIERYAAEKARVKMVIADRNVYGVDLNPMAADLAEVSLWLGTIGGEKLPTGQDSDEPYIPWFGTQLKCGNSLIGARREVVFRDGRHQKVGFNEPVPPGGVWHFLLPNEDMAPNIDKVVKEIVGKPVVEAFKKWSKDFRLPDKTKAKEKSKFDNLWRRLDRLTEAIDKLWHEAADDLKELDENTLDDVAYFGYKPKRKGGGGIEFKDQQLSLAQSQNAKTLESTSAYFRLKAIMDLNCALWFWPLDESAKVPSYEDFLLVAQLLAKKDMSGTTQQLTLDLGDADIMSDAEKDARIAAFRKSPTLDKLYEAFPFTKVANAVAARQRFLHWELEFAPIFKDRGGFDLIIGNPPWVKLQWEEAGILSEYDPHIAVRDLKANEASILRENVFEANPNIRNAYLYEYVETSGAKSYLSSVENYPMLLGCKTNLYKYFLPLSFRISTNIGVSGFIHPEGVYDDPNGGLLREEIYPRLCLHAQFINWLKLFEEPGAAMSYGMGIYGAVKPAVRFKSISKIFHPRTLEDSLSRSSESGQIPLEKDDKGNWIVEGHQHRVVDVSDETLSLFARVYDEEGTSPRQARLPSLYIRQFQHPVLSVFANSKKKMSMRKYCSTVCWDETASLKKGLIKRDTHFPIEAKEVIYSGPQFYVGTPIAKTPRIGCKSKGDYDTVDLTAATEAYRPRMNYRPGVAFSDYVARIPKFNDVPSSNYYRVFTRMMCNASNERTLIPCIMPKGYLHIITAVSYTMNDASEAANICGAWSSVPFDWFMRSTGKGHFLNDVAQLMPVLEESSFVAGRALLLNCLNKDYADLWCDAWDDSYATDNWLSSDPHLTKWADHFASGKEWSWNTPLRTQLDRRQALVELDVIVTKALGLSLDDLLLMYRVSFPTMRKYDADTYYDQNGRCAFSAKSGESYLSRKEWEAIKDMPSGEFKKTITETVFSDEPTERTIVYKAPFFKKCREDDYREAWEMLEKRGGI